MLNFSFALLPLFFVAKCIASSFEDASAGWHYETKDQSFTMKLKEYISQFEAVTADLKRKLNFRDQQDLRLPPSKAKKEDTTNMEDLLTTSWTLWKIHHSSEYKTVKLEHIKSLKNLENTLERYDLTNEYFAVFRNGIFPDIHDQRNNSAYKHKLIDESHMDIVRALWNAEMFRLPFFNGLQFKPNEISIWMNLQNNNSNNAEHSGQSTVDNQANFYLDATGIFWSETSVFSDSMKCPWTIGFSNKYKFELTIFQDTVESEEHLASLFQDKYKLSSNEKCIILKSELISIDEWKISNVNNRFVYCAVKTNLKIANKILMNFILNLTVAIFPHIPLIYAAFCCYNDGKLEIGVYLTGKDSLLVPHIRRFRAGPDDLAFTLAHKLKQIILSDISVEKEVQVLIRNAIPPENFEFMGSSCQFQSNSIKKTLQYL